MTARSHSALAFGVPRARRRPSLTPMIDVVFLLLVFFMLAARFGTDRVIPLATVSAEAGSGWSGPPRLVSVEADGLSLNGVAMGGEDLLRALRPLMPSADAPVVLRPGPEAELGDLVAATDLLRRGGIMTLVIVE